jgi:hypothetical protein
MVVSLPQRGSLGIVMVERRRRGADERSPPALLFLNAFASAELLAKKQFLPLSAAL